jgi:YesN/AraC family two-component response regulator
MLIDDEPWTMVYLKKMFQWKEKGFEVVAEMQNSMEALELADRIHPDVIFTDIRMPIMSGIDLIQELKRRGSRSEFVIVSGFAEFAYAQEAVKLGAFEYCLKPTSTEKAAELLSRLANHLESKSPSVLAADESQVLPEELETSLQAEEEGRAHFYNMLIYIKRNFSEKLQLKDLAKQFYLNSNYCCYLFSKFTGMTFSEYVTDIRMKEAARLLQYHHFTIVEIAKKSGYPDYFYFNKVFKKYYGVTPSDYRKGDES